MRRFAFAALGLLSLACPTLAHAEPEDELHVYIRAENPTPGEPPAAILVLTGVAGMGFLLKRRKTVAE